jgi:two-component system, NarL family, response regulator DegU
MIKLLIADDNPYYKLGMKAAIERETSDIRVISMCGSGEEALNQTIKIKPDIVILSSDISGFDCFETNRRMRALDKEIRIICLCHENTLHEDPLSLLDLRSDSYIEYGIPLSGLIHTIRHAIGGKRSVSPEMGFRLLEKYQEFQQRNSIRETQNLTKRQIEILSLAAQGLSNREIAEKLFIAENTVKTQMSTIIRKLNMPNRQRAAMYAIEKNIIPGLKIHNG